jgi:hypothetical protein
MTRTPDADLAGRSDGELLGRLCGTNGPTLSLLDLLWRDCAARPRRHRRRRRLGDAPTRPAWAVAAGRRATVPPLLVMQSADYNRLGNSWPSKTAASSQAFACEAVSYRF